jgi:hypothetical protein
MSAQPDPGPYRWFWASRVTRPCPDCGHPTSVGFDRADPGVSSRKPSRCVLCTEAEISNAIQCSRGELGYPLTEQGPCVSCGAPTRLYGPKGSPRCEACAQAEPTPSPSPEPSPAGSSRQPRLCPPALEAQPELDLEPSA